MKLTITRIDQLKDSFRLAMFKSDIGDGCASLHLNSEEVPEIGVATYFELDIEVDLREGINAFKLIEKSFGIKVSKGLVVLEGQIEDLYEEDLVCFRLDASAIIPINLKQKTLFKGDFVQLQLKYEELQIWY